MTLAQAVERIYANTRPEGGCLVTTRHRSQAGYARQAFGGRSCDAHRLVAEYYMGPCPEGLEVRHLCGRGSKGCVTASHLRYGTRSENRYDQYRHGYVPLYRGERHHLAALKEADIPVICRLYEEEGWTQEAIARRFGVIQITISRVVRGETWRHVPRTNGG